MDVRLRASGSSEHHDLLQAAEIVRAVRDFKLQKGVDHLRWERSPRGERPSSSLDACQVALVVVRR